MLGRKYSQNYVTVKVEVYVPLKDDIFKVNENSRMMHIKQIRFKDIVLPK